MDQDVDGNKLLFWKEVRKIESCSGIKDGNARLALYKGYRNIILRIYIIQILKSRFQSPCVTSMIFRELKWR